MALASIFFCLPQNFSWTNGPPYYAALFASVMYFAPTCSKFMSRHALANTDLIRPVKALDSFFRSSGLAKMSGITRHVQIEAKYDPSSNRNATPQVTMWVGDDLVPLIMKNFSRNWWQITSHTFLFVTQLKVSEIMPQLQHYDGFRSSSNRVGYRSHNADLDADGQDQTGSLPQGYGLSQGHRTQLLKMAIIRMFENEGYKILLRSDNKETAFNYRKSTDETCESETLMMIKEIM